MNRQVSDTIIVDGKSFRLYSNPLEGYLERGDPRPVFAAFNTAIWRGYVARWEVFDSRLFLTGLFGRGRMVPSHLIAKLPTNPFERAGHGVKFLRVADLFPEQAPLVFAEWVTERLLVPTGPRVDYVGFQSLHATYRTIDVVEGTIPQSAIGMASSGLARGAEFGASEIRRPVIRKTHTRSREITGGIRKTSRSPKASVPSILWTASVHRH
jgi:hypothetical protein